MPPKHDNPDGASRSIGEDEMDRLPRKKLPWWVKRLGIPLLILGVLTATWVTWLVRAEMALRAEVDAIRSRGEPLKYEDFPPPAVAPEKNAAIHVRDAGQEYSATVEPQFETLKTKIQTDGRWVWVDDYTGLTNYPAFRKEYSEDLRALLTASEDMVESLRKAGTCQTSDWELDYDTPSCWMRLPYLGAYRPMARFLSIAAMVQHDQGRDAEAIDTIQNILVVGDSMEGITSLISHFIAMYQNNLACDTIEKLSPDLAATPDTKRQIRTMISRLLDETTLTAGLRNSMLSERVYTYYLLEDYIRCRMTSVEAAGYTSSRALSYKPVRILLRPMFTMDEARCLRLMSAHVKAAEQKDYPSALSKIPAPPTEKTLLYPLTHKFSNDYLWRNKIFATHFQCIARRRMAAVALAVRLYRIEHGRFPAKLDELVPEYLPAVPKDPFHPKAASFRYRPDKETPIVYSVGENGADDGGLLKLNSVTTHEANKLDMVMRLYVRPTEHLTKALRLSTPAGRIRKPRRISAKSQPATSPAFAPTTHPN